MFYIIKEWHSIGGYIGVPFHSWDEYSVTLNRPNHDINFVKVDMTKDELKDIVKQKGGLDEALEYLFDIADDSNTIDEIFGE